MKERVSVIGVPISAVNMEETLQLLQQNLEEAKQSYICVSNVHTTVIAHDNPEYWAVQANSFLTLPDGKPLSVIGKRRGAAHMGQVRGVNLMQNLFAECTTNHYKHYFYGNTEEKIQTLLQELKRDYPGLLVVGAKPSVFRELAENELQQLAQEVRASGADFLWVGLGAPQQELFCGRIKGLAGAVPIGVGGAFNVLAHLVPDAPVWMQKLSLEWLYRFCKEPVRLFKRYFVTNIKFLWYLLH